MVVPVAAAPVVATVVAVGHAPVGVPVVAMIVAVHARTHGATIIRVATTVVVAVAVLFPPGPPRRPPARRRVVTPVRPLMRPRVVVVHGHSKDRPRDVLGRQLRPGPIVSGTDIPGRAEEDEVLPVIGKEVRSDGRRVL